MSTVPPTDRFEFSENSAQNEAALEELTSAIAFGQGADTITLLLVRCNYSRLRDQMVEQLGQRLAGEELQGPVQVLRLGADDHNLYAQLQTMQRVQPGAVLVLGMERLGSLEAFLVELNKRREEFRREFKFPLVLWFTDEGYRLLSKFANDFESIAGGETIEFTLSGDALTQCLQQASERLFATLLEPNTPESFNRRLDRVEFGYLQSNELGLALTELQAQGAALRPDLQASVTFAQGLNLLNQDAAALFEQSANYWQTRDPLKYGLSLFYLGRARYYAVDSIKYQNADWESALPPLQECVEVFDQAGRPDLVCKCINQLERVLHRLQRWDELEAAAQKAVDLRQQYPNPKKQAENYGFLADVAMQRRQWPQGAELAQLALDTLGRQDSWWRMLYLARLAEADYQLGKQEAAITHLQTAQQMGVMEHPTLYSNILAQLQERLREQGRYLDAFKVKQERLAVEKQYGLRAFIGAGRLRSQRTEQRGTVRSERETLEEIAPEIEASGRKRDLTELLSRIAGKTHKLLVVHGTSGVGKSSLINGGLLPALRGRSLENRQNVPVLVRKYTDWQQALVRALAEALKETTSAVVRRQGEELRREFLEEGAGEEANGAGGPLNPPMLGDFEVSSPQGWGARGASSRDSLYGTTLNQQSADLSNQILDALRVCEENTLRPVLLFDQFEEFFFANPDPLERREFFAFIADCLDLPGALKIVFSIREDYLHYLLEARQLVKRNQLGPMARAQLEDILGKQILYEIGNFSPEDTKAIIQNLASGARMYLEPGLVNALVADLAGPLREVRPIEMQVVGAQLQTENIQTLAKYQELGQQPKETLVQNYLDNVVEDCGEENRQLAELVLFLLTDERGTRPLKTRPELERELEALGVVSEDKGEAEGLDLVLRILTGSGIVVYLPDTPDDRYQLVHDYLAGVIRASQAPRLEKLVAELEEEKQKRLLLESEKADLEAANEAARGELLLIQGEREDLQEQNRKARRGLAGTMMATGIVAVLTVGTAIAASQRADKANTKATKITQLATQQEALADVRELEANVDVGVAGLRQGLATSRAKAATKREQEAQQKVEEAQQQVAISKQEQEAAEAVIESAQIELLAAQRASQRAAKDLKIARIAQEEALLEQEKAQNEAEVVQRITVLERTGVNASRSFPFQETEALFTAFKASKEAHGIIKEKGREYIAASPLLALQTGINAIRETRFTGHQGSVWQVLFSPKGSQIATHGYDGTIRLWDLSGNELAVIRGHQGGFRQLFFSPDGSQIATRGSDGTARLWDLSGNELAVMEGHQGSVWQVLFSPDGTQIATRGADGTARLWDLSGNELAVIRGHQGSVGQLFFSPDGRQIATSGADGTARLWDLSGNELAVMEGHRGRVVQLFFSPDGNQIATRGSDGTARLWDLSGNELAVMEGHQGSVEQILFSPNGSQIATRGSDGTARLWDLSGNELAVMEGHQGGVNQMLFSPDGRQIATRGTDGIPRLWDLSGNELAVMEGHQGSVEQLFFSPNGSQIATRGSDGTARLWDLSGNELAVMEGHRGRVEQLFFSPDGNQIATRGVDGTARLWDLSGNELAVMEGHQGSVEQILFSPDGNQIATSGADDKTARLWDLSGNELAVMEGHQGRVVQVLFSPDGNQIATHGSPDKTARLWDLSGNELAVMEGHQGFIWQVLFSPDGRQIATSGSDGTARLWDLEGNELAVMEGHQGSVWQVLFSPDGNQIATHGSDGTARLWDLEGNELAVMEGHRREVEQVLFSPDGNQIATRGADGTARLWDLSGNELAVIRGHQGFIWQVLFSPNGSQIATRGADGTARLWDLSGNELAVMEGHQGSVWQVLFSPDGTQIATRGSDGTARLWDLEGNELAVMEGHRGGVEQLFFSPDGSQIATSGADGTARLWDLSGNQIAQYEGTGAIRDDWQYIAVRQQPTRLNKNGAVKLWPIYTLDKLDDLFVSACEHLSPYLDNNPDRSDEDRALCGVPPLQQN